MGDGDRRQRMHGVCKMRSCATNNVKIGRRRRPPREGAMICSDGGRTDDTYASVDHDDNEGIPPS